MRGVEPKAFSVTAYDNRFEAGFGGYSSEEASIAFADGEASGQG